MFNFWPFKRKEKKSERNRVDLPIKRSSDFKATDKPADFIYGVTGTPIPVPVSSDDSNYYDDRRRSNSDSVSSYDSGSYSSGSYDSGSCSSDSSSSSSCSSD